MASDHRRRADAYSRRLDNTFGVEDEVAQKVAVALKVVSAGLLTALTA